MQIIMPHKVGKAKLKKVHFQLPVSFFIVNKVVAQGKCKMVNNITFIAVNMFQPCSMRMLPIEKVSSKLIKEVFLK